MAVKIFVKFGFVFCMALMVLAVGGCSSGSSDSSEVGVGSSEAAELEARIGVLEQQLASLPAGADGVGADGVDGVGVDGADGADGADGVDGADGADGVDGEVGPVGPAGAGATGAAGPPGADGADGIDGVDGAVGPAGEAMTFGVVGATGPAGAAGPLSGLTCGADEFAASFSGVWQCAVLGVTLDGIFSGDGTYWTATSLAFVTSKVHSQLASTPVPLRHPNACTLRLLVWRTTLFALFLVLSGIVPLTPQVTASPEPLTGLL